MPGVTEFITTVADLDNVIGQANAEAANSGVYEIELYTNASIALAQALTEIDLKSGVTLDIVGNGATINGENGTNGATPQRVLANRYREDLKHAGIGSGRHSFAFTLPAGLIVEPRAIEVCRSRRVG